MSDPPGQRLDSWKAIAAHFNRDVRTVRRWEKLEGLPVHRHSHEKLASVYAFRHELDAWSAGRAKAEALPAVRSFRTGLATAAIALISIVVVVTGIALWRPNSRTGAATSMAPVATPGRIFAAATGEDQSPRLIDLNGFVILLAIAPDGRELIGLDQEGQAIQFIDTATETVSQVLPLGAQPITMTMSPDGDWIYVSRKTGDVVRINRRARSMELVATGIDHASGLALTPDGQRLYVAAVRQGLRVVDVRTGAVSDLPTVDCPMEAVTVPGRDLLYLGYQCGGPGGRDGHDAMDVRKASTGALITTVVGPPQVSTDMVVSPDGAQIWIDGHDACFATKYDHAGCPQVPGGVLHAYRTDDHLRLATFGTSVDEQPEGLAFLADSSRVVVSGLYPRVFDTKRMAVVERSPMATHGQMVFTPDGGRAFVMTSEHKQLAIYDLAGGTCAPPPAGLVTWWSGDGHAGDVHADNDGDPGGGAGFAPGFSGQAFSFDGVDDRLTVELLSNFNPPETTIALLVKPRAINKDEVLLDHRSAAGTGFRLRRIASGQVEFCVSVGGSPCGAAGRVTSHAAAPAGAWTEIAVTETARTLTIYLNGALDAASAGPPRSARVRQDLSIGASFAGDGAFSGLIDEVRLFNLALGASEINRMHSAGRSGLCVR